MTGPITIVIPAPCSFITANDRRPWQSTYRMTRAWKHAARDAVFKTPSLAPLTYPVHITATVHRNHTRAGRWDPTNWAPTAKATVDGLVLAGLLLDDDLTRVTGPDMRPGEGRRDAALLVLELTPQQALATTPAPDTTKALASWWEELTP